MATFFGRPAANPLAPGAVAAEHALDVAEVVRQVVLGEDVDEEGAADGGRDLGFLRGPFVVLGEVLGGRPRDQGVGMPLLGGLEVAVHEGLGRLGQGFAKVSVRWWRHLRSAYLPVGRL